LELAHQGAHKIVALLLRANADIHARDANGNTPLIRAASSGHRRVVRQLLEAMSDVNAGI